MENEKPPMQGPVCPLPLSHGDKIVMGHGSGGKMSHELIARLFVPAFDNAALRAGDDAGVVRLGPETRLAISTDSHVVTPLFFPGGDIGRLAVCGTVNDVAMMGASPAYLTAGFVLEEGLELDVLARVAESMHAAALEAGVEIVAGDTKVVPKGKGDGLYINTTGIGVLANNIEIGGGGAKPGDSVILSGPMGDHGIAVLAARGELGLQVDVPSDVAPLNHLVRAMMQGGEIHVLRDPTRGGVATTLYEIARQSRTSIILDEDCLPVRPAILAACELLGFDPLYVANEGKLIAIVPPANAAAVLETMRRTRYGEEAVIIGRVSAEPRGRVLLKTRLGSTRLVDALSGEMLPRIC